MTLSPRQLADPEFRRLLAEHNRGVARARRAYEEQPIASLAGRGDGECDMPYCDRPRASRGLCDRHRRLQKQERGEAGA